MSHTNPSVSVLMGGPDAEREVSLDSGREVAAALRESCLQVHEHVIDRPTAAELDRLPGQIVFPVLHGQWGEGGGLQRLLEQIQRPYVGSDAASSAHAMDKMKTKATLTPLGVDTPRSQELAAHEPCDVPLPLVLKPVDDGSSIDLEICRDTPTLQAARSRLHLRRPRLMAESYIVGRELTVSIVGTRVLPIIEIIPATSHYDYAAKYEREDTGYQVDPPLPPGVAERCRQIAKLSFEKLGCRDVARVDIMLQDATAWFLEINTMPGFTSHSLLPKAAAAVGMPMPILCRQLVQMAQERPHRMPSPTSIRG